MSSQRRQPFTRQQFYDIYSKVPRLTVEVVILTHRGIVLALRKADGWQGYWHIPGGTVFYKESLEQAVSRLAREELGIGVKIKKLLGYLEYLSEEKNRGFGWSIGLAFLCAPTSSINSDEWAKNDIREFSTIPEKTITEQKDFLKKIFKVKDL